MTASGAKAILHWQPDDPDGEPAWSGWAEIFRGAPSWESNPELFHGLKALQNAELHQPFLHPAPGGPAPEPGRAFSWSSWAWDLPELWEGYANIGDGRKYLLLRGGRLDWSLILRFSPRAPTFAFRELARAFNAKPMERAPATAPKGKPHGVQGSKCRP